MQENEAKIVYLRSNHKYMNKPLNRIAVKVGSNVLTRNDGTLDVTRISALADQLVQLYREGIEVILISSGAVAAGRSELQHMKVTLDEVSQRQLYSAVGQAKLINRYYELFREHGIAVAQVLTTKENFSTRRHYLTQRNCILTILQQGVLPIINENDTISVTELMFTDNDELSGLIATMLNCQKLIILSNVDGIFTSNPLDPSAKLLKEITANTELEKYIQTTKSTFGRGGMLTKCRIAQKLADEGVEVIIANGNRKDILLDLLHAPQNTLCTRFKPVSHKPSSVKKWIAHSKDFAKGAIQINECAVKKLLSEEAVSLLPVGVLKIIGEFDKNDIVQILSSDNKIIGLGKVKMNSDKAKTILGQKGHKPLVHYDYLYLY